MWGWGTSGMSWYAFSSMNDVTRATLKTREIKF